MMMEYITLAGFILAIFVAGVAVGKLVEKIERFIDKKENEERINAQKNNRHKCSLRRLLCGCSLANHRRV